MSFIKIFSTSSRKENGEYTRVETRSGRPYNVEIIERDGFHDQRNNYTRFDMPVYINPVRFRYTMRRVSKRRVRRR